MMTYQLTDKELQQVPGCTPLKIYIVLNNSPNGMTAAELAEMVGSSRSRTYEICEELRKTGQIFRKSGLYSGNSDKIPEIRKEKEKNQKKEEIQQGIILSSTTTKNSELVLFEWLTADAEYVHLLCKVYELVPEGGASQEAEIEVLRPFILHFHDWLNAKRVNLQKKGAADCQDHFLRWMSSQVKRAKAAAGVSTPSPSGDSPCLRRRVSTAQPSLTQEQLNEQMLQKQRRMEQAEELQRHLEEQQKAAQDSQDAMQKFFAKHSFNKPSTTTKERRQ